jgi:hypothetical protein
MPRLVLLLVALWTVTACGGGGSGEQAGTAGATEERPAAAVELEGETLDGERLSLADFRGKPVFVNVWASW